MGKKTIDRLLTKLEENRQQDAQNAAAIFTVAQVAVNQLADQRTETSSAPALQVGNAAALTSITKEDLLQRYGNYNKCRSAAKRLGILFKGSPKWSQIIAAFNYREACQAHINAYLQQNPNPNLKGVSLVISMDSKDL
jgi:hypothetical protein